ncbi:MAG: hypothetical protein JXA92_09140 [candidate division Zixibacteria bacterium]|nr:hypothetical protein [candidate division Zixibacteria bacterium]
MKKKLLVLPVLILALVLFGSPGVWAQESGIIQATATVLSSLTIIGNHDLQFGTVTPGINKAVDKSSVGFAGEWLINGVAGAEISLDFTLPDSLILVDSTVGMRVNFSSTDASYSDGTGNQATPTGVINPNGPSAHDLGPAGDMTVWIGGTVYPSISQTGGDYTADVILTVAYTGS